ncbi:MAG: hypothetical protein IKU20_08295 [Lachnospiraceae bacterium]|nr:hypothetical protein [Lachnospiraceae bacterium]
MGNGTDQVSEPVDWAIYWYLCGSDLESKHGSASADLKEMMEVNLPDNVKVVIETGGAAEWENTKINSDVLTRFVYDKNGLKKVGTLEQANMGAEETFADFLKYCHDYHPAENSMVVLWNHGGGVLGGVAYDEIYGLDSLSMVELQNAFSGSFPEVSEPVFDIIGFDACLMANIDTANIISPYANYMIASQELEPGNGWDYTGILNALVANPQIQPEDLGISVCDSFMDGCIKHGTGAEATLSLIDLSKAEILFEQFNEYGDVLFAEALENDALFASLGRAANSAEGYGGNNKEEGYTNMVDIGGFVKSGNTTDVEIEKTVHDALDQCIVYQVKGPYRSYGSGLSCYYPLDNALSNLYQYKEGSSFEGYENLYQYQLSGKLGNAVLEYLEKKNLNYTDGEKNRISIEKLGLDDYTVNISNGNEMILNIGNRAHYLKNVDGYLAWVDMDRMQMLGIGNEIVENADWENGIFSYPFRTEWFYMDGHLLYTFFLEDQEEYNLYSTPIMLNGERVFLRLAENRDGSVTILGARKEIGENGMADKQMLQLRTGDNITTLFYLTDLESDDSDLGLKEYESFTVGSETTVRKDHLMNGVYVWTYDMVDMWNNYATSSLVMYELQDGVANEM